MNRGLSIHAYIVYPLHYCSIYWLYICCHVSNRITTIKYTPYRKHMKDGKSVRDGLRKQGRHRERRNSARKWRVCAKNYIVDILELEWGKIWIYGVGMVEGLEGGFQWRHWEGDDALGKRTNDMNRWNSTSVDWTTGAIFSGLHLIEAAVIQWK